MPAHFIRHTTLTTLILLSTGAYADQVVPLPSLYGDMTVGGNGSIVFDPGLSRCESGGYCADISNVTDAANLAMEQARQYTDAQIGDVKTYVENYVDNNVSGVDQSYVDSADARTLNDARDHTNAVSAADRTYTDSQTTQAEQRAQDYTDAASISDRAYSDEKTSQAEQTARHYTDTQSAASRVYTDDKAATAEKNANIYTDSKIQDSEASTRTYIDSSIDNSANNTYNRAVSYTDSRINEGNEYAITYSTTYTDNASKNTLVQANNYTDNRFSQSVNYTDSRFNESINHTNNKVGEVNNRVSRLDQKVDDNDRRAKAGIAGAMAMSAIPQRFDYDFNFGVGAATYGGEQALSAGSFYNVTSRTTLSAKMSLDTQHNVGGAVGFSIGW